MFSNRNFTKSPVNQTQGKKLSSDAMKGRVYEVNFGDLNPGQLPSKKIKLIVEDADGASKVAQTNFYGFDTTRDHLCGLIRKWHSLIDVFCECKTSDGFLLDFSLLLSLLEQRSNARLQHLLKDLRSNKSELLLKKFLSAPALNLH